jgi:hypothetical protein
MTPMSAREFQDIDLLSTEVSFGGKLVGPSNQLSRRERVRHKAILPRPH